MGQGLDASTSTATHMFQSGTVPATCGAHKYVLADGCVGVVARVDKAASQLWLSSRGEDGERGVVVVYDTLWFSHSLTNGSKEMAVAEQFRGIDASSLAPHTHALFGGVVAVHPRGVPGCVLLVLGTRVLRFDIPDGLVADVRGEVGNDCVPEVFITLDSPVVSSKNGPTLVFENEKLVRYPKPLQYLFCHVLDAWSYEDDAMCVGARVFDVTDFRSALTDCDFTWARDLMCNWDQYQPIALFETCVAPEQP